MGRRVAQLPPPDVEGMQEIKKAVKAAPAQAAAAKKPAPPAAPAAHCIACGNPLTLVKKVGAPGGQYACLNPEGMDGCYRFGLATLVVASGAKPATIPTPQEAPDPTEKGPGAGGNPDPTPASCRFNPPLPK